jgi:hypothetical protein
MRKRRAAFEADSRSERTSFFDIGNEKQFRTVQLETGEKKMKRKNKIMTNEFALELGVFDYTEGNIARRVTTYWKILVTSMSRLRLPLSKNPVDPGINYFDVTVRVPVAISNPNNLNWL